MESLQSIYSKCEGHRSQFLERGRDSSRITIPTILPEEGKTSATRYPTPYQSIGARGVNNLSSALLLSLLPPNAPFFRLMVDEETKMELEAVDPRVVTEVEKSLSKVERAVMDEIEVNGIRTGLFDALRHLIVTGNALLYFPDGGMMRVVHMDRYIVKRCPLGRVRTVIVKESVSPVMLPPELRGMAGESSSDSYEDHLDMYTGMVTIDDKTIEVYQEIKGQIIESTRRQIPTEESPFIPLRMGRVDGEDYGRGYVEQYYGDLQSLEGLTRALVEGTAAASKLLFLVNPNGTTRARTLAESPNGAIREGSAGDVSVLQSQKAQDFSVALNTINKIEERLSYAFLLVEGSIRNADRVTAEEIRLVTQAIERQLGGIYSILSRELSLPLVRTIMRVMKNENKLPAVPEDKVKPTIITGIEALGRGNDLNRLDTFLSGIGQLLGPEALNQYVNFSEYLKRRALSLGVDVDGLIRTEEELQMQAMQQQEAMQQQMMMQQVAAASQQEQQIEQTQQPEEATE